MKLTVLVDNAPNGELQAEHGISYFIEHNENYILFDTGHSDLFLKNAQKLNINIEKIQNIVLSHGHWDHGNGLTHISRGIKKNLITHPYSFLKRYRKSDHSYIGLNEDWSFYNKHFKLISTRLPYNISNEIIFLGEIPRENDFEAKETSYIDQKNDPDFVLDDSALAIILDNSTLAIILGCSHSGVCNIIDYAMKITGIEKIKFIIGGFHLKNIDKKTLKTIECLKKMNIEQLFPSHCTQLPALAAFYNEFKIKQVKTGDIFEI
jgi:7,8-dihydropterin-6-yl-methyl-4-(beta-D-ribofuranosyl)aminobenzene 5'-phosphate synthase